MLGCVEICRGVFRMFRMSWGMLGCVLDVLKCVLDVFGCVLDVLGCV